MFTHTNKTLIRCQKINLLTKFNVYLSNIIHYFLGFYVFLLNSISIYIFLENK